MLGANLRPNNNSRSRNPRPRGSSRDNDGDRVKPRLSTKTQKKCGRKDCPEVPPVEEGFPQFYQNLTNGETKIKKGDRAVPVVGVEGKVPIAGLVSYHVARPEATHFNPMYKSKKRLNQERINDEHRRGHHGWVLSFTSQDLADKVARVSPDLGKKFRETLLGEELRILRPATSIFRRNLCARFFVSMDGIMTMIHPDRASYRAYQRKRKFVDACMKKVRLLVAPGEVLDYEVVKSMARALKSKDPVPMNQGVINSKKKHVLPWELRESHATFCSQVDVFNTDDVSERIEEDLVFIKRPKIHDLIEAEDSDMRRRAHERRLKRDRPKRKGRAFKASRFDKLLRMDAVDNEEREERLESATNLKSLLLQGRPKEKLGIVDGVEPNPGPNLSKGRGVRLQHQLRTMRGPTNLSEAERFDFSFRHNVDHQFDDLPDTIQSDGEDWDRQETIDDFDVDLLVRCGDVEMNPGPCCVQAILDALYDQDTQNLDLTRLHMLDSPCPMCGLNLHRFHAMIILVMGVDEYACADCMREVDDTWEYAMVAESTPREILKCVLTQSLDYDCPLDHYYRVREAGDVNHLKRCGDVEMNPGPPKARRNRRPRERALVPEVPLGPVADALPAAAQFDARRRADEAAAEGHIVIDVPPQPADPAAPHRPIVGVDDVVVSKDEEAVMKLCQACSRTEDKIIDLKYLICNDGFIVPTSELPDDIFAVDVYNQLRVGDLYNFFEEMNKSEMSVLRTRVCGITWENTSKDSMKHMMGGFKIVQYRLSLKTDNNPPDRDVRPAHMMVSALRCQPWPMDVTHTLAEFPAMVQQTTRDEKISLICRLGSTAVTRRLTLRARRSLLAVLGIATLSISLFVILGHEFGWADTVPLLIVTAIVLLMVFRWVLVWLPRLIDIFLGWLWDNIVRSEYLRGRQDRERLMAQEAWRPDNEVYIPLMHPGQAEDINCAQRTDRIVEDMDFRYLIENRVDGSTAEESADRSMLHASKFHGINFDSATILKHTPQRYRELWIALFKSGVAMRTNSSSLN